MPKTQSKFKRRKFFIKKGFQSRFILFFCLLVFVGAFVSAALTVYFSRGNITSSFSVSRLEVTDTATFILPAIIYTTLITIVITALTIILLALFVSHKIAGPFFRIEQDINVIATGDLTYKIYLRKKDQLKDLSMDINQMTHSLNNKVKGLHKGVGDISRRAKELSTPDWFLNELDQLQGQIENRFKL